MADVVLATCAALPDGDPGDAPLAAALGRAGLSFAWAAWSDDTVDWGSAPVVLRSTWDYTARRAEFLGWIASVPRVLNPAPVVRWNSDKTYLRDLHDAGVPTVPTVFAAPGDPLALPQVGEYVVKPSVGAGSRGAGRFAASEGAAAIAHAAELHAAGRTAMVQPYLSEVDAAGETALVYFGATFSHAVRKGPMLAPGRAHAVNGPSLFIDENIGAREPTAAELVVGDAALRAVRGRFGADLAYARVDLLPSPEGPVVVELELTEPSLFLDHAPAAAADDLVSAIAERVGLRVDRS